MKSIYYYLIFNNGLKLNLLIIFGSLIIVFFFQNPTEKLEKYKINFWTNLEIIIYLSFSIFSMGKVSDFLYFNF